MTMTNPWIATMEPDKVEMALDRLRMEAGNGAERATAAMKYAQGDEHFALYLLLADNRCRRAIGMGIHDLGDYEWRDAYEDGRPLREAVLDCIGNDDTFSFLLNDIHGD